MKFACVVNSASDLKPSMTTALMMKRMVELGHDVLMVAAGDFELTAKDRLRIRGRWLTARAPVESWPGLKEIVVDSEDLDAMLMRTNPGRDRERVWVHDVTLMFAQLASDRGLKVLNDPRGLAAASNKLFLARLPAICRPATLVSRDAPEIVRWVKAQTRPVVLKPLHGTGGRDVFWISRGAYKNLRQVVDVIVRNDYAMAQHALLKARLGDLRVLLVDGETLDIEGCSASVLRVPQGDDFRGNVSAGAKPEAAQLTAGQRKVVAAVGPVLRSFGLFFCGLDFVGDRLVEVNVFSPGGLPTARSLYGHDYAAELVTRIERAVGPDVPKTN